MPVVSSFDANIYHGFFIQSKEGRENTNLSFLIPRQVAESTLCQQAGATTAMHILSYSSVSQKLDAKYRASHFYITPSILWWLKDIFGVSFVGYSVWSAFVVCLFPSMYVLRERRRKAAWGWGATRNSTKVREVQRYILTLISICGWHTIFLPSQLLSGCLASGPPRWFRKHYCHDQCQCDCLKPLVQC